jgi:GT2 family glycosyltransferase
MGIEEKSNLLAILIPVYNKLDFTKKCLSDLTKNLSKFNNVHYKIIIIDDGSSDNTSEWISENYPEVKILTGDGSLFWSGGINMGATYAFFTNTYEYVLLWNNDIIVQNDYFENLYKIILNEKPIGIIGTKILTLHDKNIIWSYGGYFDSKKGKADMIGYFEPDSDNFKHILEVDWCTGMGTLVHRIVAKKIGLWDEKLFPQYFGDTDFCLRAKKAGFPIIVDPSLIIYNDTSNTGLRAQNGLKILLLSLFSFRSNICIKTNVAFLRKHATSGLAFAYLTFFYFQVIGGFFKWKFLTLFGYKRNLDRFY